MEFLNRFKPGTKGLSADKIRETFISTTDKDFIHDIEKMNASAYMLGLIHAEEDNPKRKVNAADETDIPPIPFTEAMDFLKSQIPMNKKEWSELEPKLQFRAFTVAKLGEATEIEVAKQQLIAALEDGSGYAETWQRMVDIFGEGNLGFKPGYWENVFRTNTQSAYIAGKLQQYEKMGVAAYQLMVIEDSRTSRICKNLLNTATGYGLILPVDHPFWKTYGFPPYHFQCRTSISGLTKEEIGKDGNNVDNISMNEFRRRKFKPMDGFGGNPLDKESWWKMTESMIDNAVKFDIWPDILQQAYDMDMLNYQKELLKGYEEVYKGKKGGYIHQAKNWEYSKKEMDAAKKLADRGHKIYLLPKNQYVKYVKNPDCLIDNEIGEFKQQEEMTKSAIAGEIKKAKKQRARIVYIKALDDMSKDEIQEALKSEIFRSPIKMIYLDWKGSILDLKRKMIRLGKW